MNILFDQPLYGPRSKEQKKIASPDALALRTLSERLQKTNLLTATLAMPIHHGAGALWLYEIFFWAQEGRLEIEERDGQKKRIVYQGADLVQASTLASQLLKAMKNQGWQGGDISAKSLEKALRSALEKNLKNPGPQG